ncbi:MAG: PaaI family thioesterase [Acidimicrobiales bacterium]
MESSGEDPAARLADELRGAIEELSSVAHDPERVAQAVTMAAELRTFLDGPKSPRWYEARRVDGQLDEISAAAFNNQSLYRGAHNPLAPPMAMTLVEDDGGRRIEARVRLNVAYEGPPHGVHGGYVAGMFDEVLGATQRMMDKPGVTGRLTVHYRNITPIEEDLLLKAWIIEDVGRRIVAKATCHAGETLTADAEGLFIRVDFEEVAERMAARRDGGTGV